MEETYTSKDVCKLTGCTHRQLQYWEQKNYLTPTLGSRNVRYYNESTIQIIKQIIRNKKSGKSLGEAYVLGEQHALTPELVRSDLISALQQLEEDWFSKNKDILLILDQIFKLENTIPRYPYFMYNEGDLVALKNLQEKAIKLKHQKDQLYYEIKSRMLENSSSPSSQATTPSLIPEDLVSEAPKDHYFSIDQLVLLCMKKNSAINTHSIRDNLSARLRAGETASQIANKIFNEPIEELRRNNPY